MKNELNENIQSPVTPLDPLYVGETRITFKLNSTNQFGKIIDLKRNKFLWKTEGIQIL